MITDAGMRRYAALLERVQPPTAYELDLVVECAACFAYVGRRCTGLPRGTVHFARRLRRLLEGVVATTKSELFPGTGQASVHDTKPAGLEAGEVPRGESSSGDAVNLKAALEPRDGPAVAPASPGRKRRAKKTPPRR